MICPRLAVQFLQRACFVTVFVSASACRQQSSTESTAATDSSDATPDAAAEPTNLDTDAAPASDEGDASASDSSPTSPTETDDAVESDVSSEGDVTSTPVSSTDPSDEAETPEELDTAATGDVTWHQNIAPLVHENCGSCHGESGIAPFSLLTYEVAKPLAGLMLEEIEAQRMPPWGARSTDECTPPHAFKDDVSLSSAERSLFQDWVAAGAPEGDPDTAAPLPNLPSLRLENPTLNVGINQEVTVDGNEDEFYCFSIDPGFDEDVWLTASQINAGNSAIVHHVLVFADPRGESAELADENGSYPCFGGPMLSRTQLLGAWAPGSVPWRTPEGSAMHVAAGSRLVLNVHYHPNGRAETDSSTSVDFNLQTEAPEQTAVMLLVGNFANGNSGLMPGPNDRTDEPEFRIPAGVSGHTELQEVPVSLPLIALGARIWSVGTHMHLLGTDMKMSLEREDGSELCLLQTPDWDFDWQRAYTYDVPSGQGVGLAVGDILTMRCTYDNTMANEGTATALAEQGLDAPVDVYLGEGSLDEMCLGVFGLTIPGAWSTDDILSQL